MILEADAPQKHHMDQFTESVYDHSYRLEAALTFREYLLDFNGHRFERFKRYKPFQELV